MVAMNTEKSPAIKANEDVAQDKPKNGKKLGNLRMVWNAAKHYPSY